MNAQLDIVKANDDYRRAVLAHSYGRRTDHHRRFRLTDLLRRG